MLVWGQISNLGSFRVKFQSSLKVGKLYIKMTLLTSAFQKKGHEVNKGHPRSKISKIGQISKVIESRLMVYKNDALAVSFLIEGVMR